HMGVAIDARETSGAAADLLVKHFDQITPENQMKPEAIQPSEGRFTFGAADHLLDFSEANGIRVYGHVLVWHSQTPDWFFSGPDGKPLTNSPQDQQIALDRMKAHIDAVAAHMKGRVWAFDVVNEVIDESQSDGQRRSRWYEILGPDYIAQAFIFARAAFGPDTKLFINDYNTEFPAKRAAYYALVKSLVDAGVPIDGVGHQFHAALSRQPSLLDETLTTFTDLGLMQAITEIDVSISKSSNESLPETPPERLVEQGYYMVELGAVLRKHADQLASVTFWGLTDNRSWLRHWPIERPHEAPLLFDAQLQAKPAFWGLVDPSKLPHNPRSATVFQADMSGDSEDEWQMLPGITLRAAPDSPPKATLFLRWDTGTLFARLKVNDTAIEDGDQATFFVGDQAQTVLRADGVPTAAGWMIDVKLPIPSSDSLAFDVRVTDVSSGQISWGDLTNTQESAPQKRGTLNLLGALNRADVPKATTAPVIDGEVDDIWSTAVMVPTGVTVEGDGSGAKAEAAFLWDESGIYVLAKVTDPSLDQANSNAWEQDSVEIFLAPGNERLGPFEPFDGQYRVSYANQVSIAGDLGRIGDFLTSAAKIVDGGYVIEARIALPRLRPGKVLGADIQINDATGGKRTAV
ncbi:MAG: endo-1,4-beta-xylanase, partial [Deltaproteobacteria bacterium]